jgi:hypothetical protein
MKGVVLTIRRFFSVTVGSLLSSSSPVPAKRGARRPARTAAKQSVAAASPAVQKNQWRAVSITPCSAPCAAARNVAGKRFLVGEVPHLPLRDCDSGECKCTYQHHEDRRDPGNDRRQFEAATQTLLYGQVADDGCRRRRRGRRKTD